MNTFTRAYMASTVVCFVFFYILFFGACQGAVAMSCSAQSMRTLDMPAELILPEGQAWVAERVLDEAAKAGMDSVILVRFTVGEEGKLAVSGYDGCNFFFGGYTVTEVSLQFGQMGVTRRMCAPDPVLESQTQAMYDIMTKPVEIVRDAELMTWWQDGKEAILWTVAKDPFYRPKKTN